ncbi:hypothetical protein C8R44DRAFT_730234 [Mycena epipterygia]|nr:hypothetical protein C8R44DRAFT_730234 [Mycena epipterygia]
MFTFVKWCQTPTNTRMQNTCGAGPFAYLFLRNTTFICRKCDLFKPLVEEVAAHSSNTSNHFSAALQRAIWSERSSGDLLEITGAGGVVGIQFSELDRGNAEKNFGKIRVRVISLGLLLPRGAHRETDESAVDCTAARQRGPCVTCHKSEALEPQAANGVGSLVRCRLGLRVDVAGSRIVIPSARSATGQTQDPLQRPPICGE